MLFSPLKLSLPCPSINHKPVLSLPSFSYTLEWSRRLPNQFQLKDHILLSRSLTLWFGFDNSSKKWRLFISSHNKLNAGETSSVTGCHEQWHNGFSCEGRTSCQGNQLNGASHFVQNPSNEDNKESQRRRKIGLANKGKVPWNKGKRHSEETRERIRHRTKEAMRDPKVRKKMSECPRAHSNQTKARIRSSLRKVWRERQRWKRSREKFLNAWAKRIGEAARKGWVGQQELDWNSYDKEKREIALEQLQWAADRARAEEMRRIRAARAARAARAKEEKMVLLSHTRKQLELKVKTGEEIKRKTQKKSREEKEALADMQKLKLKEKLTKIHKSKSTSGQVTNQDHRTWEKFDLQLEKERKQKEVSLADQIVAAKSKRAESAPGEALLSSYGYFST